MVNSHRKNKQANLHKGIIMCTFFVIAFFISMVSVFAEDGNKTEESNAEDFKFSEFNWDEFHDKKRGFWEDFCKDADGKTDEECEFTILNAQKKFYKKLYKSLAKYEKKGIITYGTEEYRYVDDIILETVFYEMNPSLFADDGSEYADLYDQADGKGMYTIDDADVEDPEIDIDYTNEKALSYFAEENDTVKLLVQNLIAYTTDCYGIYGDPIYVETDSGDKYATCEQGDPVTLPKRGEKCSAHISGPNSMGFWIYYISKLQHDETLPWYQRGLALAFLGRNPIDEYYTTCKSYDSLYPEKTMYVYNDDPTLSTDRYFDFLSYNQYFDNKAHLQRKFKETILDPAGVDCMTNKVCSNSLESLGTDKVDYYEGEAILVRREIIEDILSILNNYGFEITYSPLDSVKYNEVEDQTAARKSFYWPIGSDETEERNGVIYADKDPASTDVISKFGTRENPITGEVEEHYGIDISGIDGVTNVIAVYRGEVISVVDSCTVGDYECNEGYGNTIIISHSNNDYTVYAHLASIDPSVTVGATVDKGQLIGKVGQTGKTNVPCLHYELRKGGNDILHAIDPLGEHDTENPRPKVAEGDFSVHETTLTKEEFVTKLRAYCVNNACSASFMNVFVANAELVYDVSVASNVNPELVVIRGAKEGMSPGGNTHNYWGIGCANGKGVQACYTYSSLTDGIKGFAKVVAKYDTVSEMMSKYAYIGAVWYKPGSWSLGGCKYYEYIKKYMSASRAATVSNVCYQGPDCSSTGQAGCTPTNDEDQKAYAMYNASAMVNMRYVAFGL